MAVAAANSNTSPQGSDVFGAVCSVWTAEGTVKRRRLCAPHHLQRALTTVADHRAISALQ